MKRFHFRLGRVQRAREISESLARSQWQAAEHDALDAEAASDELETRIREARAELGRLQESETLRPGDVLSADRALARAWQSLASKRERAAKERAAAEERREAWLLCERDRRALERLEERQRELYRAELTREEDAETDE